MAGPRLISVKHLRKSTLVSTLTFFSDFFFVLFFSSLFIYLFIHNLNIVKSPVTYLSILRFLFHFDFHFIDVN